MDLPEQSETQSEAAQEVRLIYEVYEKSESTTAAPMANEKINYEEKKEKKEWKKNSCILVLGSVKTGKSTTINLYTGSNAETGSDRRTTSQTDKIKFYKDVLHNKAGLLCWRPVAYPKWMDTPGSEAGMRYW